MEHYKRLLEKALEDGEISAEEEGMLKEFRQRYGISEEQDKKMREGVLV